MQFSRSSNFADRIISGGDSIEKEKENAEIFLLQDGKFFTDEDGFLLSGVSDEETFNDWIVFNNIKGEFAEPISETHMEIVKILRDYHKEKRRAPLIEEMGNLLTPILDEVITHVDITRRLLKLYLLFADGPVGACRVAGICWQARWK